LTHPLGLSVTLTSVNGRMAVEYVYALHDFVPQNDDEIAFEAGERIEVIEKDDLYGDGWWTVSIYYNTTGI
jgi:SH3 domain